MSIKFLNRVAAGALLVSATALSPVAAFAQAATTPSDTTTQAPAGDTMQTPSTTEGAAATTPAATTDTAEVSNSYLTEQAPDQISANTYIGQTVYNSGNENIGDINDLILKKDGGIVAAVIGVGGFLGIGEKYVAVPVTNIAVTQDAEGSNLKLTTTETAETLKAAPEFKTLSMLQSERSATAEPGMLPTDGTTTSSTTNGTQPTPAE